MARIKIIRDLVMWCYYHSRTNINIKLKIAG